MQKPAPSHCMSKLRISVLAFLLPFLSLHAWDVGAGARHQLDSVPTQPIIYLFPGLGSTEAVFKDFEIAGFDHCVIQYPSHPQHFLDGVCPDSLLTLFAQILGEQIDTSREFYYCGLSFGGMCAVELAKWIPPNKTVILSTAKTGDELPTRLKFQRTIPLYRCFGGKAYQKLGGLARKIFLHDAKETLAHSKKMLEEVSPDLLSFSVKAIIHWQNQSVPENLVHLQGSKDYVFPLKNLDNVICLKGSSHQMYLTETDRILKLIAAALACSV